MPRKRVQFDQNFFKLAARAYGIPHYCEWEIAGNAVRIRNKATGDYHPFVHGPLEVVVREKRILDKIPSIVKPKKR